MVVRTHACSGGLAVTVGAGSRMIEFDELLAPVAAIFLKYCSLDNPEGGAPR